MFEFIVGFLLVGFVGFLLVMFLVNSAFLDVKSFKEKLSEGELYTTNTFTKDNKEIYRYNVIGFRGLYSTLMLMQDQDTVYVYPLKRSVFTNYLDCVFGIFYNYFKKVRDEW